jgi:hypothetical protein
MRPDGFFMPSRVGCRAGLAAQAQPYGLFFGSGWHGDKNGLMGRDPTRHYGGGQHHRQRCAPMVVSQRRKLRGRRTPSRLELRPLRSRRCMPTRPELHPSRAARRQRRLMEGAVHTDTVGAPPPEGGQEVAEAAHADTRRRSVP